MSGITPKVCGTPGLDLLQPSSSSGKRKADQCSTDSSSEVAKGIFAADAPSGTNSDLSHKFVYPANKRPCHESSSIGDGAAVNRLSQQQGRRVIDIERYMYKGQRKDGKPDGLGTMVFPNGDVYKGNWILGKFEGQGKKFFASGEVYKGEFRGGKYHGQGTMTFPNGNRCMGSWVDGMLHGQGMITFPNGDIYQGEFKNGKKHGQGTMILANGKVYEGFWVDGENHAGAE